MVEGITSRAFINSNLACTPATTVNANIARVATIAATKAIVSTEFQSEIRQANPPITGSQSYQYTLVEPSITVSEVSLTRVKNAVRTISEPAKTITESLVKKVTHQLSQTTAITEGLTRQKTATRSLSEPPNAIGESLNRITHKVRTISEPANTIGESLVTNKHFNRTISESAIAITESLAKHAIKSRQIIEPVTDISDTLIHIKTAELSESPITITESLQANRIFSRGISESVPISGSTYSYNPDSFTSVSFIDSPYSSIETLVKQVTHNIAEVTTITENLIKLRLVVKNLSETVPLQPETIQRLVTHYLNEPVTNIAESLIALKIYQRTLSETPIVITESLAVSRHFKRSINPQSFTDASFTTGAFESFNVPSGDVTEITEELEGFILPPGVFNLIEPAIDVTESLVSAKTVYRTITEDPITIGESLTGIIPIPVPTTGGGGANRRRIRRARYNAYLRSLQPVKVPVPEPEHEPLIFEIDITEPPIAITETLVPLKTVKEKVIVSVAAAAPPPQIIEKVVKKLVYVDRIKEVEKEIQPPPIIKAQDVIVSKPKPIEIEHEILVSTQSHSNKMKSKAASTKLQILQELMTLTEMEGMV